MSTHSFTDHLNDSQNLTTPYEATRAGFVAIALEKNRKATPFVEEAKVLKSRASQCSTAAELLTIEEIRSPLLTASGISEKANNHLTDDDRNNAIKDLIEKYLEPAGTAFPEELVYRFLLTRGDSLGGSMRNLAGKLGERKLSRAIISSLNLEGRKYRWLHDKSNTWIDQSEDDADIELNLKGLRWDVGDKKRTLIYNLTVPLVRKNVDLCLFDTTETGYSKTGNSCHTDHSKYIALGELKGGIDPAGADEHWKTANSALERIRSAFGTKQLSPMTFFVGAAIETAMAEEIYAQLKTDVLRNAANLTNEDHVLSLCNWLIHI